MPTTSLAAVEPPPMALRITPELVAAYAERVYRFAAMVARGDQDAEDLAQDALVRVLKQGHRFDPERGELDGWLWRIVVNLAHDAGRAAGRRRFLAQRLGAWATPQATVESDALQRIDNQRLLAAVRRLPRRARTLVALRYGAGLSYAEIGAQLGISSQAALMATRRAFDRLRRSLEDSR
jgi:RNA polymerase sigma-70 factor (ECF subfamily)